MGSTSRWWLHHSLKALSASLGKKLSVYHGNPQTILDDIITRFDVEAVYWNRCYEPWRMPRDTGIKKNLRTRGVEVHTCNGSLLWEPWNIKKDDGTPYKVFTPFYRKGCLNTEESHTPLSKPENVNYVEDRDHVGIDALDLLPKVPWDKKLETNWDISEECARKRFEAFINVGLSSYKDGRNIPTKPYVSCLSPYLHFGEISPNQLWYGVRNISDDKHVEHFCSELGWREFSYS